MAGKCSGHHGCYFQIHSGCGYTERAKTVAKVLVDKWFYTYCIPTQIPSDKG